MPERLKEGTVTPIYKGGDKSVCSNYRPVVLPSHVAKVFERLVAREVMDHLESEGLLGNYQHEFRRGRSCVSQLAQHYHRVLRVLEEGYEADVVYLDFSKAFDRVDHGLLLCKLKMLGIRGGLLWWIKSFLIGRRKRVVVNG